MSALDSIRSVYAARDAAQLRERYAEGTRAGAYYRETLRAALKRAVTRRPVAANAVIADLGCGFGEWLGELADFGVNRGRLIGVDLLEWRLIAQARGQAALCCADCSQLPLADQSVDVALQFMMLSSMPSGDMRARFAAEARRVLKPGGVLLSYDAAYANPANPNLFPIPARELRRLFPRCRTTLERITLAPPLTRWTSRRAPALTQVFDKLPFLRTHLFAEIRAAS